jgi:hypothetical protein
MAFRLFYICRVRLDGDDKFVVWYQNERDGFVLDPGGGLMAAGSADAIATTALERGISLVSREATDYDFDRIIDWCRHPSPKGVECPTFLNAWNFFDDLAAIHEFPDTDYARLSRVGCHSYDKLFWGCNLAPVTPPGERFDPTWSQEDLDEIRTSLEAGLVLLRSKLRTA